jgi:type IV pilus assembly protein PilM
MSTQVYLYKDKPLFGLDIGHGSIKVMQIDPKTRGNSKGTRLIGYGSINFDPNAIQKGVIDKPDIIAAAVLKLFKHHLTGDITSRRVAVTLPSYRTYSRSIQMPKLGRKEAHESVMLEMEQYIPIPIDELYIDYTVVDQTPELMNVFAIAVPKVVVDSYVTLMQILGLEPVFIETTLGAAVRLFSTDKHSDLVSVIIDFGAESSDISIFDASILVTGTVGSGGNTFTERIKEKLSVSDAEAHLIKSKYGLNLSKKQEQIRQALEPELNVIVKEIKRMSRYYEERFGTTRPIGQVITIGGGSNMPGLTDYLVNALRMPVRTYDPWHRLQSNTLQPPSHAERSMYSTVTGLSLCDPKEVFRA